MPANERIAGVVLAGGRSSRMGRNKALLDFHGRVLLEHMRDLIAEAGCDPVLVSGSVPGYPGIPDNLPHQGPARALAPLLQHLEDFQGVLVVPVDMPFLPVAALRRLLDEPGSACFSRRPLPALFRPPFRGGDADSMAALLANQGAAELPLPASWEAGMINLNTPQQWREATGDESASGR